MADDNGGGSNTLLALIVGELLVVVVIFFVFGGFPGQQREGPSIKIETPKVSETRQSVHRPIDMDVEGNRRLFFGKCGDFFVSFVRAGSLDLCRDP